jgi:transposase
MVGIRLTLTEESYTSKCDSLSLEKVCKHESYLGDRIKRGLFQSGTGKLLNADVNGGVNIMRKVVDDSYVSKIINRGLLFNPIKVDNLFTINSKLLLKKFN